MRPAPALMPAVDEVLMIDPPPWSFMWRAARCAAEQHAEDVDVDHPVEVAEVVVQEAGHRAGDAGVVRHHVQPTEPLDGEVDQRLHLVGVGDVGLLERGGVAERGGQRLAGVGVDVGDDDPGALGDEALDAWPGRCRCRRR